MYYRYYAGSVQRPAHFGIRTHQHKLIYYDGLTRNSESDRWEFYDLVDDPRETRNAYDDARYKTLIEGLKRRLEKLQSEVGDAP